MSTTKGRKVKRRAGQLNITKGKAPLRVRPSKQMVLSATRKIKKTRTRRFIAYALVCIVLMQVVRYVLYTYIYIGSDTPDGIAFIIIIYVQTGLMLASLGLLSAAAISYLNNLSD